MSDKSEEELKLESEISNIINEHATIKTKVLIRENTREIGVLFSLNLNDIELMKKIMEVFVKHGYTTPLYSDEMGKFEICFRTAPQKFVRPGESEGGMKYGC